MKTKGIRILDKDHKCIPLSKLLENIPNEKPLFWALLWLDVTPLENEGKYLMALEKKTNQLEKALLLTFESLLEISKKVFQEINVTIIACKAKEDLHHYKEDQEMYETCDIVIEMIDGCFGKFFQKI